MKTDGNIKSLVENKNKMIKYLTSNNREMLNKYEKGYISVRDAIEDTNLERHYFYNVAEELDPHVSEKRKNNRMKELKELTKQISLCIPFEYVDINYNVIFGERSNIHEAEKKNQKVRLTNILTKNKIMPQNFKWISIDRTLSSWYRTYLISEKILKGDQSYYSISKDFNLNPSKVYDVRDYMRANDSNKILPSESIEQENQFLQNVKLFEEYKNGASEEELSEKYDIEVKYVHKIIESLNVVDLKFKRIRVQVEYKRGTGIESLAKEFNLPIDVVKEFVEDIKK
ncbi:hypothetical protein KJJ36_14060 [Staphylococcus pseudoxylosus]|uniref:hypothetical protein n=1 Tax=Staphylococcus pseudoxylosus TaxID=2282419 RepID=UPI001F42E16D|nr:hypothetical protein [Staphylococcus pseudoxylosus]MCE5003492.1 hypothetical protein [Staphylococcus pseudoxylosus]